MALSCIPEYAAAQRAGGVGYATLVNQLTGILEQETAVRFRLANDNYKLILLRGGPLPPSPFVNNFPASDGSHQNQDNMHLPIGDANYSLGMLMTMNGANRLFRLTVTDTNGNPLNYSRKEMGLRRFGPIDALRVTNMPPLLFRSWRPTASPTRCFPRLAELANNTLSRDEVLPTVTRSPSAVWPATCAPGRPAWWAASRRATW